MALLSRANFPQVYGIADHISRDDYEACLRTYPVTASAQKQNAKMRRAKQESGIKAAGNWDMHPDLRQKQWCQEQH